ncbi:MAG: sugar phosphate nucleotidyltransferase [Patescibacteria group bacterium]|nr:sugar phosphate nucleotidyltransferase [Patescibacteria group bacterium]MDD5121685.1 sugar phosphate nucleotidyltransferase [Patescibacteria group bacterium]MDD5222086.1 sugar phosphate nucleotidyltransferase [Patescibacteria group bacterium]MDD5396151.1 sugar phosphate nucleotidyltransferase [Patescibacteria group bacterium]
MKGIILAGGNGTRMLPCTRITNKHCLPVYDKPMIYHPLETLTKAGIKEVMIVTGGNNPGDFLKLLENGKEFGLKEIRYAYQEGAGGIAEALGLAENFAKGDGVVVILGDNIFEDDIAPYVKKFINQVRGGKVFLKEVSDPERFGVADIKGDKITDIEEKPKNPKSNYAVTGLYMYDSQVWDLIKKLKPSGRGELEITDVNNFYIRNNSLTYEIVKGFWSDAGTFDSLLRAANFLAGKNKN